MFTCRACGHDDMVHVIFVGCCGHQYCPCTGMDGDDKCQKPEHGDACWWAIPRPFGPQLPPLDRAEADDIFALHDAGMGTKNIARSYGVRVKRPIIIQTIRGQWWPRRETA